MLKVEWIIKHTYKGEPQKKTQQKKKKKKKNSKCVECWHPHGLGYLSRTSSDGASATYVIWHLHVKRLLEGPTDAL
ncbi:hypothetical protein GCM10020229_34200 [Kitasatospora albolonga]